MIHVRVLLVGAVLALAVVCTVLFARSRMDGAGGAVHTAALAGASAASSEAGSIDPVVGAQRSRDGDSAEERRGDATLGSDRNARPVVVLVHGLGRRPASMAPLGRSLVGAGFRVVNLGYPSWTRSADSLVTLLADSVASCCAEAGDEVHFVTHSLGGILVRKYIQEHSPDHQGRVVMLSPPNGGSEIIDFVQTVPGLRALLGPTGIELGTDSTSLPNRLGPAQFELGVITGDRSLNPIYSWLIPGPDDGKVSVERAQVDGAEQFLVVPFSHSFIMTRATVVTEIQAFLANGSFSEQALSDWGYTPPTRPADSAAVQDSTTVPDSARSDQVPAAPTG